MTDRTGGMDDSMQNDATQNGAVGRGVGGSGAVGGGARGGALQDAVAGIDAGDTPLTPAEPDAEVTAEAAAAGVPAKDRGSFSQRFLAAGGDGLVAGILGAATVASAASAPVGGAFGVGDWLTVVFAVLSLFVTCWAAIASDSNVPGAIYPTGALTIPRLLVLVGIGIGFASRGGGADAVAGWIVIGALLALLVAEPTYRLIVRGAIPYAVHVPGLRIRNSPLVGNRVIFWANTACLVLVCAALMAFSSAWIVTGVLVAIAVLLSVVGAGDGVLRVRARRMADRRITMLLTEYKPTFAVHWDAEAGTGYQLAMWLPYLDRLGENYIVIVRNARSFHEITRLTRHPVLLRQALADMDAMVVPSLTTAFYVNNAVRNAHFARYTQLNHVQLNHGDSDKAPSFNPVFRMFDHDFVAGQAAIDRFAAHGVHTRPGFFEIVGRPQVDAVEVAARPSAPPAAPSASASAPSASASAPSASAPTPPGSGRDAATSATDATFGPTPGRNGRNGGDGAAPRAPRILYAPTWAGFHADSAYSSLPIGPAIVRALLERGCEVVYRPHPYTHRDRQHARLSAQIKQLLEQDARSSGRAHVWGRRAETELSVFDCFNEVDAMVADISSVVPDFLYSEKPFALCAMSGSVAALEEELPIAAAGYAIESDAANLDAVLTDLLGTDPKRAARHDLKTYYLGDFAPEHYADAFLDAAGRVIRHRKR